MPGCPPLAELKSAFLEGTAETLPGPYEDHVLECAVCAEALLQMTTDADLLVAVRRALSAVHGAGEDVGPWEPDTELDALIDRLTRVVTEAVRTEAAGGECTERADALEIWQRWFAPAQDAGELGRLAGFRILRPLGRGGMGVVFEAEDVQLRRRVALKLILPHLVGSDRIRERFLREARAAAKIRSPQIVAVLQVGEVEGLPYIVQELLEGQTVAQRLRAAERIPVHEACEIIRQTLTGLAAAHALGLVHRDIKPENIFLAHAPLDVDQQADSAPRPGFACKLLDFGVARWLAAQPDITGRGIAVGTPAYMAPEQARGEEVDSRADLFSLGCVLYEMLTGVSPFVGPDVLATLSALAFIQPPPPCALSGGTPRELSQYTMRLLAKDKAQRPASAVEALRDLAALTAENPAEPRPRWRTALWAGGGLLGSSAGALFLQMRRGRRTEPHGRAAEEVQPLATGGRSPPDPDPPPPLRQARILRNHERAMAEWILQRQGAISVLGADDEVRWEAMVNNEHAVIPAPQLFAVGDLPDYPFVLCGASINSATDDDVQQICRCEHLRSIQMWSNPITDRCLEYYAALPLVRCLYLGNNQISDDGVRRLEGTQTLEYLDVGATNITDEAVPVISRLRRLRFLSLHGTNVTDRCVESLKRLPQLEMLFLAQTLITVEGYLEVRRTMPDCLITWNARGRVNDDAD